MATKYRIEVTLTKKRAEDLESVLMKGHQHALSGIVGEAIETQAGPTVTFEVTKRRDALAMLSAALNDVQMGGDVLTPKTLAEIERAFFAAFEERLRG